MWLICNKTCTCLGNVYLGVPHGTACFIIEELGAGPDALVSPGNIMQSMSELEKLWKLSLRKQIAYELGSGTHDMNSIERST